MVTPPINYWYEVYRDFIQLAPILAVCGTILLIPVGIVAFVQWRKVAVARQMRKLVGDLVKHGYQAKDIERIAESLRSLRMDPEDDFSWDVPENDDDFRRRHE